MKAIDEVLKGCEHDGSYIPVNDVIRCMQEYARQFTPKWIKVTDFLPKIGHSVIVYVEYVSKGIDTNQTFCGYMDEDGDLISMPEDDHYGWSFAECVTHWMPLPEMPEV